MVLYGVLGKLVGLVSPTILKSNNPKTFTVLSAVATFKELLLSSIPSYLTAMHFLAAVYAVIFTFNVATASVTTPPLYLETIVTAGRRAPVPRTPTTLPADLIKKLQFFAFLEDMESSFFDKRLQNPTDTDTNRYLNHTVQVDGKVTMVS